VPGAHTFRDFLLADLFAHDENGLATKGAELARELTVGANGLGGLDGSALREYLIQRDSSAKDWVWSLWNTFTIWQKTSQRLPAETVDPQRFRELFHTYEQLLNAPPLNFAIRDFWQSDGVNLIGGLSGHMKTFILVSIAKALLTGHSLWNHFPVDERATRVLYLVPESALGPFAHRLKLFGLLRFCAPDDERLLVRTLSLGRTPALSDPRLLFAARGAHVILDTAVRFAEEMDDESNARQSHEFATLLFDLLAAGARSVGGAHHSPKAFAKESVMSLEGVLRGSGDIGAMLATAYGVKLIDRDQSIVHVENIKPRDFAPPKPFQLQGRPFIDEEGDFRMVKKPGECGSLADEQPPLDKNAQAHGARAAKIGLVSAWLKEDPEPSTTEIRERFSRMGIKTDASTVRGYKHEIRRSSKQTV